LGRSVPDPLASLAGWPRSDGAYSSRQVPDSGGRFQRSHSAQLQRHCVLAIPSFGQLVSAQAGKIFAQAGKIFQAGDQIGNYAGGQIIHAANIRQKFFLPQSATGCGLQNA
jgi:hypothetical protein